jgi:hypothetical protein
LSEGRYKALIAAYERNQKRLGKSFNATHPATIAATTSVAWLPRSRRSLP